MYLRNLIAALAVVFTMLPPALLRADEDAHPVAFPHGFRRWNHVKSMLIGKGHSLYEAFGGIHHVYVNDVGYLALRRKTELPNGTALAFDLLDVRGSGGATSEGRRKFVAVMVRDTEKYPDTEGWGWQAFKGGSPRKPVLKSLGEQKACATCHKEVGAKQFVFSEWRN